MDRAAVSGKPKDNYLTSFNPPLFPHEMVGLAGAISRRLAEVPGAALLAVYDTGSADRGPSVIITHKDYIGDGSENDKKVREVSQEVVGVMISPEQLFNNYIRPEHGEAIVAGLRDSGLIAEAEPLRP